MAAPPDRDEYPVIMRIRLTVSLCLLLVASPTLATTVYEWTDSSGTTHFSTEPPESGVEARTREMESGSRPAPSARVREIRCRDFRGALTQLRELSDVADGNARWLAAKEYAAEKTQQWCGE